MHMTAIRNVDSTYVQRIFGRFMITWHMANLPVGVSMVASIVQFVWMTLMHLGWSMEEKPPSLIVIEGSFRRIILSGVTDGRFEKGIMLEKGHRSENWEQIS
jgi:hypothetical protein